MEKQPFATAKVVKLHPVDQARRFLSVLMHDDHDAWYGLHISYTIYGERVWQPNVLRISPGALSSFDVTAFDGFDSYVNVNGFCSRRRTEGNLRHVNSLMFDLDVEAAHRGELTGMALEGAKESGLSLIASAIRSSRLPRPTMVVDTGRGLQLHYVLERTASYRQASGEVNKPLLAVVERARSGLASLLREVCDVPGCELSLDERASDLSRLCRIPGSTNTHSASRSALLSCDGPLWSLGSLLRFAPVRSRRAGSRQAGNTSCGRGDSFGDPLASELLCRLRMSKLRSLRDYREARGGCTGTRNELVFCFVNSVFPLYGPSKALELGREFNNAFSEPLSDGEVRASVSGISRNGVYRFSRRRLAEHVCLTEEEERAVGFFDLPTAKEARRKAEKSRRAKAKGARDARMLSLAKEGLAYESIAKEVGVSRRTVCAVLGKAGYSRRRRVARKATTCHVPMVRRGVTKPSIRHLFRPVEDVPFSSESAIFCPRTYCEGATHVPSVPGSVSEAPLPDPAFERAWPPGQVGGQSPGKPASILRKPQVSKLEITQ